MGVEVLGEGEPLTSDLVAYRSEEKDYDYDDPGFSEETGHFTQ